MLPEHLKIPNDLFMDYKGILIINIKEDIKNNLIEARKIRPSILYIINDVYNKIKTHYIYGINRELLQD